MVGDEVTARPGHAGATTLITDGFTVALLSGFRGMGDLLTTAEPRDDGLHETGRFRLALPSGARPAAASIVGRGPDLHVFQGVDWYRADLGDIRPGAVSRPSR